MCGYPTSTLTMPRSDDYNGLDVSTNAGKSLSHSLFASGRLFAMSAVVPLRTTFGRESARKVAGQFESRLTSA